MLFAWGIFVSSLGSWLGLLQGLCGGLVVMWVWYVDMMCIGHVVDNILSDVNFKHDSAHR